MNGGAGISRRQSEYRHQDSHLPRTPKDYDAPCKRSMLKITLDRPRCMHGKQ